MHAAPLLAIVLNPVSGPTRTRGAEWEWLEGLARESGWEPRLFMSEGEGHIEALVREAIALGARRVVVAGGDGSINEALQGLANTDVELGIIPAGTSNILANELSLPADFQAAARVAFHGAALAIDVGRANGRYFALMVGIGYDAVTVISMWPQLKRLAGQMAYTLAGIQAFVSHRATRMTIRIDGGKRLRRLVYMLVVANTRLYGRSNASVAEHADVRDGYFDLCVFRTRSWYHVIFGLIRVLLRVPTRFSRIETHPCRQIEIRSARPVPYQLDGDLRGVLPLTVEMCPRALKVVMADS
ncbi:MAG TPA: diacylglycerol kinase family protein [Pantanalinema sp.]